MKNHTKTLYWKEKHRQSVLQIIILVAVLAMGTVLIHPVSALDPLDRASVENSMLVNTVGEPIGAKINVNKQVQIVSDIRNNQDKTQDFIYIIQIKNVANEVVSLGWFSGDLLVGQTISPALSWTPKMGGQYNAEIFVWDSLRGQSPLADTTVIKITVS